MDYRQDAASSPSSREIGRHELPVKTFFDGTKLSMVESRPKNHHIWYKLPLSPLANHSEPRRRTSSTAIAAASLLASIAISGSAIGASPAATPNLLPAESRGVTQAPPPQPINWDKVTQEATDLLSKYIQMNTTNPPGDELDAAQMLKEKFLTDGIPATTWEPQPGRGLVAARLRGIGKHNKSIILLSHMDVVPANPREWQVPPFGGAL